MARTSTSENPAAAAPLEALGDVAMLRGDLAAALAAYRGVAAATGPGDPAGLAGTARTLEQAADDALRLLDRASEGDPVH